MIINSVMLALSFTRCIVISFVAKAHMLWAIPRHFPPSSLISPYDYYTTPRHKPRTSSQQQQQDQSREAAAAVTTVTTAKRMAWGVVWFLVSAAREGRSLRVRVPWPAAFLLFPFGGLLLS